MREVVVSSIRPATREALGKDAHDYLEYIGSCLDVAGRRGTDIACLPEYFVDQGQFAQEAEVVPGPISTYLMQRAREHRMYVVAPLVEELGGKKYNSALLIDRSGDVVGRYHKTHLVPVMERETMGLSPGESLPVFSTDFGKIGIMTCFDGMFPEVAAVLARKGAEIIFYPHAMDSPDPYAYRLHVRARAMDNGVYVVTSTRGVRRGEAWSPISTYHTYMVGPDGGIVAGSSHEEGVLTTVIDLERKWRVYGYAEAGTHDMRRVLSKHRRPDLYRKEDVD